MVRDKRRVSKQPTAAPRGAAPATPAPIPSPPSPEAVALEAAIIADPGDTAAYAVYADWLQQQGDPRGELITLMLAREAELAAPRDPKRRSALPQAINRHVERHAAALIGSLAQLAPELGDFASGAWRAGFIHRLTLKRPEPAEILRSVLAHPSGRLLRELVVEAMTARDGHAVIDALVERDRPALIELELIVTSEPRGGERLDATALWPAVPNLRRVNIAARDFELGGVHAPAAERVRFAASRLSIADIRAIAVAPWSVLQRLELRFGGRFEPSAGTIDDLAPLLTRADLPALTHLKLRGCAYAGEALTMIAGGPLARQLVVIDLSHGHVEREDLRALSRHLGSFPALRELWLPSFIVTEAQRVLAGIATHLISDARSALDNFL